MQQHTLKRESENREKRKAEYEREEAENRNSVMIYSICLIIAILTEYILYC